MKRQWRHSAILREESCVVHNNDGYKEYLDVMCTMEIYTGEINVNVALSLLILDFSGTMQSYFFLWEVHCSLAFAREL